MAYIPFINPTTLVTGSNSSQVQTAATRKDVAPLTTVE